MNTELAQIKRQNRLLKIAIATGSLLLTLVAADSAKSRFKEIDVERINIISPDGKREMVISNRNLFPRAVINGKESSEDRGMPGIAFYNDIGDECGGLIYKGKLDSKGNPSSGMHFSMDRFGGDQQLALGHYENNGFMDTGLNIYDRGLEKDYAPLLEALKKADTEKEKSEIRQKLEEAGARQTQRLFVGKSLDQASAVVLADAKGLPRIMMIVTPKGEAKMMFFNDSGEVLYSLPPKPDNSGSK
ncbi:MAG: hypothetical protein LBB40_00720 [Holophagales bacterium]|jgi:hypothetical protein|nr:hypothetical protein [Holophagales bacterium]